MVFCNGVAELAGADAVNGRPVIKRCVLGSVAVVLGEVTGVAAKGFSDLTGLD